MKSWKNKKPRQPSDQIEDIRYLVFEEPAAIIDTEQIEGLKEKIEKKKERINKLELKVKILIEEKEEMNETYTKSKEDTKYYKKKSIEIQKLFDEFIEKNALQNFNLNFDRLAKEQFQHKIRSLENTVQNMSESLIQYEADFKRLTDEKNSQLENNIIDTIQNIEFYDIKLEDYLKNISIKNNVKLYLYIHNF